MKHVPPMSNEKKKTGCLGTLVKLFFIIILIGVVASIFTVRHEDKAISTTTTSEPTQSPPTTAQQPPPVAPIAFAPLHTLALKPGIYYVTQDVLEERLAPGAGAAVTNRIHRGQRVDVFESKSGWARVSKYYDGAVEGQRGEVARWVIASGLSTDKPQPLKQPSMPRDPRIAEGAFPKVGESGLTERDVRILHKGALKFLTSGAVTRVVSGDKSTNKPNTYFIYGGGPKNLFFTASEVNE